MITTKTPKVIIVDSDGGTFNLISSHLKNRVILMRAKNLKSALNLIKKNKPEVIVADLKFDVSNGFELIRLANDCNSHKSKFILISDQDGPLLVNDQDFLFSLGITKYLLKSNCSPTKTVKVILNELKIN